MKLWGKLAKIILVVIAVVFAVVAFVMPDQRWQASLTVVIALVAARYGVPALVRWFSSFTGDEEVLSTGIPGSAAITSLAPTWLTFNDCPVVKFSLAVEASGASYPVELKQAVGPEVLDRLAPGVIVSVRVDRQNHKKVVIDWGEAIRSGQEAAGSESAEQQATAPHSSAPEPARRSILPFLCWGFLFCGLFYFRLSCEEDYYEKGGARVQGIVLQKTYSRYVAYRFSTKEGRTIEGRYQVLPATWQELKEGGPVTIEYLAEAPDTNRVPDQRARSMTLTIIALVLLVASAVLFIIRWRQRQSQKL
jgi:hypothetical protein